jgi:SAM-dependent MidA family methyltransferase
MEFLLDHHAKFSADIDELKEVQRRQAENLDKLTANVGTMREEMGKHFENLIVANEVTRGLAEQATRLTITVSQRVTGIDQRVIDL